MVATFIDEYFPVILAVGILLPFFALVLLSLRDVGNDKE